MLVAAAACKGREATPARLPVQAAGKDVSMEIKSGFWEVYKRLIVPSDGMKLKATLVLLDVDNNQHQLGKLIARPTLVFRYSFKDCDMCIDSAYRTLEKTKLFSGKNAVFITDARSYRAFSIRAKATNFNLPVYCVQSDDMKGLGLPAENQNLPFFFVLGPDLVASKFFVPYKEMTAETNDYLNIVADFLK